MDFAVFYTNTCNIRTENSFFFCGKEKAIEVCFKNNNSYFTKVYDINVAVTFVNSV